MKRITTIIPTIIIIIIILVSTVFIMYSGPLESLQCYPFSTTIHNSSSDNINKTNLIKTYSLDASCQLNLN